MAALWQHIDNRVPEMVLGTTIEQSWLGVYLRQCFEMFGRKVLGIVREELVTKLLVTSLLVNNC